MENTEAILNNIDTVLYISPKDNQSNMRENYADPKTNPEPGKILGTGYDIRFGYLKNIQGNQTFRYGAQLRNSLSLGKGYSAEVYDFDSEVVVRVTYNNTATCRSASKVFLIVFDLSKKGGKGLVKNSVARWRSISDISQAASYIRSCANSLQSYTSSAE